MTDLGEMEQRLLSELEEPGDMDAPTLLSETTACTGDMSEVRAAQAALTALVEAGLVVAGERAPANGWWLQEMSKDKSLVAIADLGARVVFSSNDRRWIGAGKSRFEIVATEAGLAAAEDVLRRHDGYRWWRSDRDA
ncbi:MAG: hypothetical protein AB7K67_14525 [Hyphomicrobiaceae bacterium]|jgi:hypothetical protein